VPSEAAAVPGVIVGAGAPVSLYASVVAPGILLYVALLSPALLCHWYVREPLPR